MVLWWGKKVACLTMRCDMLRLKCQDDYLVPSNIPMNNRNYGEMLTIVKSRCWV